MDLPAAVQSAVMEQDVEELEHGLETTLGAKGVKLSGGQLQRAAAARMFVRQPELLVFDDLSSALDIETERTLWERVFERSDATCLVVSHRKAALRRADHIIVLRDGKVEAEGRLDVLMASSEEMQRLWHGDRASTDLESAVSTLQQMEGDQRPDLALGRALDDVFERALDRDFELVLDQAFEDIQ